MIVDVEIWKIFSSVAGALISVIMGMVLYEIRRLGRKVDDLMTLTTESRTRVEDLDRRFTSLDGRLSHHENKTQDQFEKVAERLGRIEQGVSAIDARRGSGGT